MVTFPIAGKFKNIPLFSSSIHFSQNHRFSLGVKFFLFFNVCRSEVKQSGWFSTSEPIEHYITEERKRPIYRSTRVTSTRFTATPRTRHQPAKLTPLPVTVPQPTGLTPRSLVPTARSVTSNQIKVYTRHQDEDQSSQAMLPPTTTAMVVKKPVR